MHPAPSEAAPAGVIDRSDTPRGRLATAWPIAALALLLLLLVRSCVPGTASAPTPPFDLATATRQANTAALTALRALPPQAELPQALAAINAVVINFASGSDVVPVEMGALIEVSAAVIAALPAGTRILITGHTDNVGHPTANLALSQRRADSVRALLIARGAAAEALAAEGVGGSQPVASNSTEAGRFRNRRIEFSAVP